MQRGVSTGKRGAGRCHARRSRRSERTGRPPRFCLRTAGTGSCLAPIVGSNNHLKPDVPLPEIPTAFLYLGCWFLMAGLVYYFFGMETKRKSIAEIDRELAPA